MKKVFYYTFWNFTNPESDGICKKILSQIDVMEKHGYQVDYSFYRNGDTFVRKNGDETKIAKFNPIWNKLFGNKKLAEYIKKNSYDSVYCRYAFADRYFMKFLKNCQKYQNNVKVVIEIPTYPYDGEVSKDFLGRLFLTIDKFHRKNMKRFVDKIVTYSNDKYIYDIPTICIMNGVDFAKLSIRKPVEQCDKVNIIAVATISKWHGYDRMLEGIGEYYRSGGERDILFHIVGGGHQEEIMRLKSITEKWKIQDKIIFYGPKSQKDLDMIYDKCDLAAESFGIHRKKLRLSSSLKSREYMAKGLPIIASVDIDVFQKKETPYFLKVPCDESPINMEDVLDFYDRIYQNKSREAVAKEIRDMAEGICDMSVVMKPVIEYFDEDR